MKIFFIAVGGLFAVVFIAGMITAAVRNSGKRRRASSLIAMSRIPETIRAKLVDIFREYQRKDAEKTNALVNDLDSSSLGTLLAIIKPENRPAQLSSGRLGDKILQSTMEKTLIEKGYSSNANKIITGIFLHDLDGILSEMAKKPSRKMELLAKLQLLLNLKKKLSKKQSKKISSDK